MAASESYPEELLYNAEHDWARIDGDEAVLGITWYAADSLGELVHFEPPEPGATIERSRSYGEVESVKAVSDLISPLSGEVLEVNEKVTSAPETVNWPWVPKRRSALLPTASRISRTPVSRSTGWPRPKLSPMQPNPMADTSNLFLPSVRVCIVSSNRN